MSIPIDVLAVLDALNGNTSTLRLDADVKRARAAVAELIEQATLSERMLRDMADAGFGDPTQADGLRAALARAGGAA